MRQLIAFLFLACTVYLAYPCFSQLGGQADKSHASKSHSAKARKSASASSKTFAKVTVWDIQLVSFTTLYGYCSEEEAREIEARGDDECWVGYDETTGMWTKHCFESIPTHHTIITNASMVKKLNDMMKDPKYSDYRNNVKVKGNKATARWYDGNRGGGIPDDFPADVYKFIMK